MYYEVLFYYGTAFFARSASGLPSLAFVLYVAVLHLLLRRQWNAARERPARRLLFLRTFGGAERSERMLDSLDDTWRRLGRIDLIAGTDLAMRTLGSRMLEASLLRRADAEFLNTPDDVHRRLGHLRSERRGTRGFRLTRSLLRERMAVCWPSWRRTDVVPMDLSGFTPKNTGCVFELTQLAHLVPLERLVLIADGSTDRVALEEVLHGAWARLPSSSPNAHVSGTALTVLVCAGRAVDDERALVAVVLHAGVRQKEEAAHGPA